MGAQSLAVACGALALCLTLAGATNPGFVVRITQAGLDYAHQLGITMLEKELATAKLPNISGDTDIKVVGNVHYEFSSLRLLNFRLPDSRISLVPNVGLQVSVSNASADVNGTWMVKILFLQDHGTFDVKFEDVNVKINLTLGSDDYGKPTIDTSYCNVHMSKVEVQFTGKLAWLYNLFHNIIEPQLRKILENRVCDIVANSVRNDLQPYIQTLPVTAKIDAIAGVDYSLVRPPTATAQSLDVPMKGECYFLNQRSAVPFSPPALALPPDHDRMVYFGVSNYFFNTASFVYHKAGMMFYEITDSMIPKTANFHLKTDSFSAFIPQLKTLYPHRRLTFMVFAPSAPFLNIGEGGFLLQPVVDVQAYALIPVLRPAPLFHLSMTGNVSAAINVKSGQIIGNLTVGRIKLTLKHSDIGPFKVEVLESIMNIVASNILVPRINDRLGQGFPLPLLDRIQLSDVLVEFHQNLLLLGANVHYQPQV